MSRTTAKRACWAALTGDTQNSILKDLIDDGHPSAQLATVSRQWQKTIECHNFEHIQLTLWRMPEFGLMTERNRALIKCISLSLELEGDGGNLWEASLENPRVSRTTDNCTVIKALHDLFWMLSTWKPQGQLQLEISIYFPSRNADNSSPAPTTRGSRQADKHWWQTLPEAPAVTSLLIRVQRGRPWRPETLDNLVSRLPNLEEFSYKNARALAYYKRIQEQYYSEPSRLHYLATEFDPSRRPDANM
ncbi:hypothetical protein F5Y16DRAFT_410886 [Xylariaceae sp. FL0255]|nr:hypothetical protein F5Y16DRAFT_410886 [Xylariaceae sp. FL0255]